MRNWNLTPGNPLQLTIAADARFVFPDYANDHIWDLDLSGGDPSALALRTTFGLRARLMRIFPRFTENNKAISDPTQFAIPPSIRAFYPNFISVSFSPTKELEVEADYWMAASQVAAGRFTVTNHSAKQHAIRFELIGQCAPLKGQSMTSTLRQSVTTLEGQVEDLYPVLFVTGGPQPGPGPYSSLSLMLDMPAGAVRQISWALAALKDAQGSFDLARKTIARPFDAEKALIENRNSSETVEIFTGDVDWDAALAFSQKTAFSLIMGPSAHLPSPSFVLSRQADQGFSRQADGSDYPHFWSGQSVLEAYYLATLMPAAPQISRGILQNFLSVQDTHNGFIDCKPGLAGQRGRFLAAPLLASLTWRLSHNGQDKEFIHSVYPGLSKFFWYWFSPNIDLDRNGLPEWQNPLQTGFEENPLFDGWHPWSMGVNISTVQSPALLSALYHEAQCLIKMAEQTGHPSDTLTLNAQAEILQRGIQSCWDVDGLKYHYADKQTHLSLPGRTILEQQAEPAVNINLEFKHPVRLLLRIIGENDTHKRPRVTISGRFDGHQQTETIEARQFIFSANGTVVSSEKVYNSLEFIEFDGLNSQDRINLQTVDLTITDHTLLLPLWAGVPDAHDAQALVYRTILDANQFDHPFGIAALPGWMDSGADPVGNSVHIPWNQLIAEGLLSYGYRTEAVRLTAHIMNAVIQNLKHSQSFYRTYHAETGAGLGERNTIQGLAPLGLFLQTLGIEIDSPTRVILRGENLYPWPVTVKYKGLKVTRRLGQTEVIFPNQQSVTIKDPTNTVVTCE